MAAPSAWRFYNGFSELSMDGTIDLDTHAFRMALFLSTSNAATLSTVGYSNLTNEVAQAYGYLTTGKALTPTWNRSVGTTTFDADDQVWTASGGSITARFVVIYDNTSTNKDLVCYSLLDTAPADVTATDGNTLTIAFHSSGCFTFTPPTA
jgi:hypothetical protein